MLSLPFVAVQISRRLVVSAALQGHQAPFHGHAGEGEELESEAFSVRDGGVSIRHGGDQHVEQKDRGQEYEGEKHDLRRHLRSGLFGNRPLLESNHEAKQRQHPDLEGAQLVRNAVRCSGKNDHVSSREPEEDEDEHAAEAEDVGEDDAVHHDGVVTEGAEGAQEGEHVVPAARERDARQDVAVLVLAVPQDRRDHRAHAERHQYHAEVVETEKDAPRGLVVACRPPQQPELDDVMQAGRDVNDFCQDVETRSNQDNAFDGETLCFSQVPGQKLGGRVVVDILQGSFHSPPSECGHEKKVIDQPAVKK